MNMDQQEQAGQKVGSGLSSDRTWEAGSLFRKGRKYHTNGNYQEALRHYVKAVKLDLDNVEIWVNIGMLYSALRKYEDALRAYYMVGRLDPSFYEGREKVAGEYEEKVLRTLSHRVSPHRYTVLLRDFEEMLGIQDKALPIIPHYTSEPSDRMTPGKVEEEVPETPQEANDRIAMEFGRIKNLDEPWSNHFDEVIGYYKNIFHTIEQRPEIPYYYQLQEHEDWVRSVKHDIDHSLDLYDEHLPHFEKDTKRQLISDIAQNLARILDFERAIQVCSRSFEIDPDFTQTRMIHAHCNSYIGRFGEALEQYENALNTSDSMDVRCEILELKGVVHFRLGEMKKAVDCFKTALRISRKLTQSGKVRDGRACYERSMSNVENLAFMSEILYLKGRAHLLEEEKAQAEQCFQQAKQIAHSAS